MRKITIPLLSPTILFLSITGIIGSFQVFDYIYFFFEDNRSVGGADHRVRDRSDRLP